MFQPNFLFNHLPYEPMLQPIFCLKIYPMVLCFNQFSVNHLPYDPILQPIF